MAPSEDLRDILLGIDSEQVVDNAAYLAEKHASGQLSHEDYILLQQIPSGRQDYVEQFWHQSRRGILHAYLQGHLSLADVMHLLGVK